MPRNLPAAVGIGLRAPHIAEFQTLRPRVPFIEVHAENHVCGGPMRRVLHHLRDDYPISLHCVGLSIGSAEGIDQSHLRRVAALAAEIEPFLVSDHLSVASLGGLYSNDLIPIPYVEESLALAARHVESIQDALGRQILIENPSRYVEFAHADMEEGDFLAELARRTGCGVLCDVNNIYVTARNFGRDAFAEFGKFPAEAVKEIHIAGHATEVDAAGTVLVDTHDRRACADVVRLFAAARARFGAVPSLLEWDNDLPDLDVLLDEALRVATGMTNEARYAFA